MLQTSKFCFFPLLVTGFVLCCQGAVYKEFLNTEDLEALFGEDYCVEGYLSVTESGTPVIQSDNYVPSEHPHLPLTKTKEKEKNDSFIDISPISLVYELATFNGIGVQFTLTDEKGPSHKKQFVISLKLGDEEFLGEGTSIKKAQQEASKLALNSTLYSQPPKRNKSNVVFKNNKTPVQKLETWARKHDDVTVEYTFNEQTRLMVKDQHRNYYHRDMYSETQNIHKARIQIKDKTFNGEGPSLEIAKERAASNALESLKSIDGFCMLNDKEKSFFSKMFDSDNNSPISLVTEFGMISNTPVSFDLYSEEGPAHIKKFVFRCIVGNKFETFGEGSSKKSAKLESAKNMLMELKKQISLNEIDCTKTPSKTKSKRKKSKNLIKSVVKKYSEDDEEEEANRAQFIIPDKLDPVSKLFQIQQAKHDIVPDFKLKEQKNNIFYYEVTVNDLTASGSGPNKKTAKKNAAQALLEKMGYSDTQKKNQNLSQQKKKDFSNVEDTLSINSITSGLNLNSNRIHKTENIKESGQEHGNSESRNDNTKKLKSKFGSDNVPQSKDSLQKRDLKSEPQRKSDIKPKSQLASLSQQLGFKFQFSDYPKMDEFVTFLSLTTDPPRLCYGTGKTSDQAEDKAALHALEILYKSQINDISRLLQEENTASPTKTKMTMIDEDNIVRSGAARETD